MRAAKKLGASPIPGSLEDDQQRLRAMTQLRDIARYMQAKGMLHMPSPKIAPIKVGLFGEQGTGKTATTGRLAAALSKLHHNGAPVWVTDPELGWKFTKRRIFGTEKIELVHRTVPTFKAMMQDLREAERSGACCYAVELAKPWMELLHTVQRRCGDRWGQELVKLWDEWVTAFLNSPLHCFALARVSDLTEEVLNDNGEQRRIKVGEGMKAGGQRNNFGYEPHLVLRLNLERLPRRKQGQLIEGEGRMVHRADVLKDRTEELNGKVFRWKDQQGYKPGSFAPVWKDIEPHFAETQLCDIVTLDANASSSDLVDDDGRSAWSADRREREALLDEFEKLGELMFGGQTADAKRIRLLVAEAVTGEISKNRIAELPTIRIHDAVKWLKSYRKRYESEGMPTTQSGLLEQLRLAKEDLEAQQPSLNEVLLKRSIDIAQSKKPNGRQKPASPETVSVAGAD